MFAVYKPFLKIVHVFTINKHVFIYLFRHLTKSMRSAKEALDMLRWREGYGLGRAEIWYVHRGAPDDAIIVKGSDVTELRASFFSVEDSEIPYHRVFRILFDGEPFFERPAKRASPARQRKRMRRTRR